MVTRRDVLESDVFIRSHPSATRPYLEADSTRPIRDRPFGNEPCIEYEWRRDSSRSLLSYYAPGYEMIRLETWPIFVQEQDKRRDGMKRRVLEDTIRGLTCRVFSNVETEFTDAKC